MLKALSAAAALLLATMALAACGDSYTADTTAEVDPVPTSTEAEATGPIGTLDSDGLGEAKQGMSVDEVIALFGKPETQETVPGCELDSNAHNLISLIYNSQDGTTGLLFDEPSGALQSYYTVESSLETSQGIGVGDTYDDLASAAGDELKPLALGVEPTAKEGVWYLDDGPEQHLTFDVQKGRITQIMGGYTPPCE